MPKDNMWGGVKQKVDGIRIVFNQITYVRIPKNPKHNEGTVLPVLIKQGRHLWKNDEDKLWKSKMKKKMGRQSSGHETPIPSQRLALFSIWSKALTTRLSSLKKGRGQTDGSAGVSLARLSSSAQPSGFVNFVVSSALRRERWLLLVRDLTWRRLRRKRETVNEKKKRFEFLMLWRSEDCVPIKGNWSTRRILIHKCMH